MEVIAKVQAIVMEHAFTIGIGLLVVILVTGAAWFWMTNKPTESVLKNEARMNSEPESEEKEPVDIPQPNSSPELDNQQS